MEHAARGMSEYIRHHFEPNSSILIVCGVGNNGADGIVLARTLWGDYDVRLYVPFELKSNMAKIQMQRAKNLGVELADSISECNVIVDALFGAGLNRELDTNTTELIKKLNMLSSYKIACDVPTGILEDGKVCDEVFCADVTITMGALKKSLYSDRAKDFVGKIICVDLGVSRNLYEMDSDTYLLEFDDMRLPSRGIQNSHKGTFGHSVIFVGEKIGAGVIAGMASARFGAGLTTLITTEKIDIPYHLMQNDNLPKNTTAIAIGMGLGGYFDDEFLQKNVIDSQMPIVLDADAFYEPKLLQILSQKHRKIVITPHPKEFASMWQILCNESLSIEYIQNHRFEIAKRFSKLYPNVVLLLKGANMLIAYQNQTFINPYATSNLSKGGSGDVLSGLIVSLLAQRYTPLEATTNASLALAKASCVYPKASYSLLPQDIIELLANLEAK
jgi:hydroxyethylthiazole kinase-like uncharacterized protein yjeF